MGFFGPLLPVLRLTGCKLDILELNGRPRHNTAGGRQSPAGSLQCSHITATSIITGTIDGLLAGLGTPRAAVILGPSSIMCPQVFSGTPVTHIAGAWVRNSAAVEKVVSEGGGTMLLRKHVDFETVCL